MSYPGNPGLNFPMCCDPASAAVVGAGALGAIGSSKAASKAQKGANQAAQLQQQTAMEQLAMMENFADYSMAKDQYLKNLAERNTGLQLGMYSDARNFQENQWNLQIAQQNWKNQLTGSGLMNLQNFSNLGLEGAPGLSKMTGGSGSGEFFSGPKNLSELAANNPIPNIQGMKLQPTAVDYQPVNDELMNAYVENRAQERYGSKEEKPTEPNKSINVQSIAADIKADPFGYDKSAILDAYEKGLLTEEEKDKLIVLQNVQKAIKKNTQNQFGRD